MKPYSKFYYYMYHFPSLDSITFLKTAFSQYYLKNNEIYTDQISRREIGFIPFNGTMVRHKSLHDYNDLHTFLMRTVPRHFYHSLAFYDHPEDRSMQAKGWRGAEFVFDLDADHIENADKMSYEQILAEVKKHTQRLIEKFLMGYLSIDGDSLRLLFSGSRGYHIHINGDAFYPMNSDQRREISNLVRGEGLTTMSFLQMVMHSGLNSVGWVSDIDSLFRREVCGIIAGKSSLILGSEKSEELKAVLETKPRSLKKGPKFESYINNREPKVIYEYLSKIEKELLDSIVLDFKKMNSCEIDEPVSTDIHRLIRFPYSLHGKTGLIVKPIKLDDLKDFDPLTDAVFKFGGGSTEIVVKNRFRIRFNGEEYDLEGRMSLPDPLAVFMVSSGRGNLE